MNREEFDEIRTKENAYINEFIELCKKHGLALISDDPYCGLEIVPYREMEESYNKANSFGRLEYEEYERRSEYCDQGPSSWVWDGLKAIKKALNV